MNETEITRRAGSAQASAAPSVFDMQTDTQISTDIAAQTIEAQDREVTQTIEEVIRALEGKESAVPPPA